MDNATLNLTLQMAGTVAFAVTAVLAVSSRGIDLFGACVMGIITAIGGGTIRDVILGEPVFWSRELSYIWVAFAASVITFFGRGLFERKNLYRLMLYVDALGVALFAIQAAAKVSSLNFGRPVAPVILGIVTAIGGGLIRDVLAGRQNLLMSRDLYAIPVLIGCSLFAVVLELMPEQQYAGGLVCILLIFGFRCAAIYWELQVPSWLTSHSKTEIGADKHSGAN